MRKRLSRIFKRSLIRPILYKAFSRLVYSLTLALLWNTFLNRSPVGLATAFLLLTAVLLAAAWIARLRMDGAHLPRLPAKKLLPRKKSAILYGDMIDHIDEEIPRFEDLEKEDQDAALIVADLIVAAIYLIASLFV